MSDDIDWNQVARSTHAFLPLPDIDPCYEKQMKEFFGEHDKIMNFTDAGVNAYDEDHMRPKSVGHYMFLGDRELYIERALWLMMAHSKYTPLNGNGVRDAVYCCRMDGPMYFMLSVAKEKINDGADPYFYINNLAWMAQNEKERYDG